MNDFATEDVLVFNFASGERTTQLSEYCFKQLGFTNIITLDSNSGFTDKFKECAKIATESKYKIFIRNDADRLVYDGLLLLLDNFKKDNVDCAEGRGYEFFMNKSRGATPHIFSKKVLSLLHSNHNLMPDVQKPEQHFINSLVNKNIIKEKTYKILTNLHEYEQYPSKFFNSILNRISRGHLGHYNMEYLKSLSPYSQALSLAIDSDLKDKKSMNHLEYDFLDKDMQEIKSIDIDKYYKKYKNLYETKK